MHHSGGTRLDLSRWWFFPGEQTITYCSGVSDGVEVRCVARPQPPALLLGLFLFRNKRGRNFNPDYAVVFCVLSKSPVARD